MSLLAILRWILPAGLWRLATVYAKNEESDLTAAQRRLMAKTVEEIEEYLKDRYGI